MILSISDLEGCRNPETAPTKQCFREADERRSCFGGIAVGIYFESNEAEVMRCDSRAKRKMTSADCDTVRNGPFDSCCRARVTPTRQSNLRDRRPAGRSLRLRSGTYVKSPTILHAP